MNNNIRGKKLLIQGAGRGNLGLLKVAKLNGVYTIVTSMKGDYPCIPLADTVCFTDITDTDAILQVARAKNVDGVAICCIDTGLKGVGRCCDVLGLRGISENAAIVANDKYLMKECLVKAGVRTAQFCKVRNALELSDVANNIGYPVIVKATDLQGSRGITIVRNERQLLSAFQDSMYQTKKDYCIIEEYIDGKEYGVQAFVYDGKVLFVLPHGDETMMCKTAVPIGHYMPYKMSRELYEDTCFQVKNAIKAINFNNCAVNVDLIEREGKAYIIELTARVGANALPELTSNYFGINYYEMILTMALGESPLEIFNKRTPPCATYARVIRFDRNGIIKSISVPQLEDTEIHMFVHEGSEVREFTNCNDAIGEIIVKGKDLFECQNKLATALSAIKIELL